MSLLEQLTAVFAPHCCVVCSKEGFVICDWCRPDAFELLPSSCFRCNTLTSDFRMCKKCSRLAPLKHVWVSCRYEGVTKDLIRGLKYERKKAYVNELALLLDEQLPYLVGTEVALSWLPTASDRRRRRGFDQAELIARRLGAIRGLRVERTLVRLDQERQVGKNKQQRLSTEFDFIAQGSVKDKTVILIDDVITTGATLSTAAKALKVAGAKEVSAAVVASNLRSSTATHKLV